MNIRFVELSEMTLDDVFRLFENRAYKWFNFGQFCDNLRRVGVRIV